MIKVEKIKPEVTKVLKRIQDSVPQEWLDKLNKRVPIAPTIKYAFERAVKDPNVSEELKRKAQIMLDSGYLDKEVDKIDKRYEGYISRYIDKEIEKAVARGEIPKSKKYRNVSKKLKRIIKTKNERHNSKTS